MMQDVRKSLLWQIQTAEADISFYILSMNRNVWKRTFWRVRRNKTQISLNIHAVWSEFSLSAWRNVAALAIKNAQVKILIRLRKWEINILTTNKFVKVTMLWTTELWQLFLLTRRFLCCSSFLFVCWLLQICRYALSLFSSLSLSLSLFYGASGRLCFVIVAFRK